MENTLFRRAGAWRWLAALLLGLAGLLLNSCSTSRELPSKLITFGFQTLDPQVGIPVVMPITKLTYRCIPVTDLTELDLESVSVGVSQNVRCLVFQFNQDGQRKLWRDTALHPGLMMYTMVNGAVIGACMIEQPLEDAQMTVFVEIPDDQLMQYAKDLQDSINKLQAMRR